MTTSVSCPHHVPQSHAPHSLADRMAAQAEETVLAESRPGPEHPGGTTGILLINHGSRSPAWRRLLLDVHQEVADQLLAIPGVGQVNTAFMEYTEPSIATQLRALDEAGMEHVVIIPLLLTISDHSYDDVPAICGQSEDPKVLAQLAKERIEVYRPRATLEFAPLLDFSGLVQRNITRRIATLLGTRDVGARYGLVLVGYGSADFNDDWDLFFTTIREYAEAELAIDRTTHAWCGHLVTYSRQPTIDAIESLLPEVDEVIVMPVLVAYDPMFQDAIIGTAVERCSAPGRVRYRPDSILPEPEVGEWVVEIAASLVGARR